MSPKFCLLIIIHLYLIALYAQELKSDKESRSNSSNSNNSTSINNRPDILTSRDKLKTCPGAHIRNDLKSFEQLRGCNIIDGPLTIALVSNSTHPYKPESYGNLSFPQLFEITEYLLFFRVQGLTSLSKLFPNLAVIRGKELVSDYALVVYEMMHLQQIDLPKLSDILRGSVRLENNPNLCYARTVNWNAICKNKFKKHFIQNNNRDCSNRCPNHCRPWNLTTINLGTELQVDDDMFGSANNPTTFCWNSKDCHEMCQNPDGTTSVMSPKGGCCSPQCAGGCFDEGRSDQCISCRSVSQQGKCVEHCDHSLYEYKGRCISELECKKTIPIAQPDKCEKPTDPHTVTNLKAIRLAGEKHGRCQATCPAGYEEDPTNKSKCKPCDRGRCRKVCTGGDNGKPFMVNNVNNLEELAGCNAFNGSLEIVLKGGKNVLAELEKAFQDLEEIRGFLKITRSYPILTLGFLSNLKVINGSELYRGQYSLVIVNNPNLQELFMFNDTNSGAKQLTIARGKLFAHLNPKLCPYRIDNLKSYSTIGDWDEKDVSPHTNGDKEACSQNKLEVKVVRTKPTHALISFQNYALNMTDPRSLLYYLITYRVASNGTVTMFDGRDGCNSQNDLWTTQEEQPITSRTEKYQQAFIKVRPATRYALYVKTFTLFAESKGALSDIIYFETGPDTPGIPKEYKAYSDTSNSVLVSWSSPTKPNGVIEYYVISITKSPDLYDKSLHDTDICQSSHDRGKITQVVTKEEPTHSFLKPTNVTTNNTNEIAPITCQPTSTSDINLDIQTEVLTFQDLIIDMVYLRHTPCVNSSSARTRKRRSVDTNIMTTTPNSNFDTRDAKMNQPSKFKNTSFERATSNASDIINFPPTIKFNPLMNKTEANVTARSDGKYSYSIKDLEHYTSYQIEVFACQANFSSTEYVQVSNTYNRCGFKAITSIRTQAIELNDRIDYRSIVFHSANESFIHDRVVWQPPMNPNGVILAYKVRYRLKDVVNAYWTESCINTTVYHQYRGLLLTNLGPGSYVLRVQAVTLYSVVGQRIWSEPDIEFEIFPKGYITGWTLVALIFVSFIIVLFLIAASTYCIQKRKDARNGLIYVSANPDYHDYTPDEWEVDKDDITIEERIGGGAFGQVHKGTLKTAAGLVKCAIKTLPSSYTAKQRVDFLNEASIMKEFNTYHVVKLFGVVSITTPVYVIMELMEYNDLKSFLRSLREEHQREKKDVVDGIYLMAAQIADGMAYLASKRYVHRDLAARNCMVGENRVVKIGDFGLARDIYHLDYYRRGTQDCLPVRWMAPESLRDNLFTSSTDVWSYGIVVWEIVTFSAFPYQGKTNEEVMEYVKSGNILSRPENCPDKLYHLMQKCWKKNDKERPTFIDIIEYLLPMTENKLFPNCFYRKEKVEGDTIEKSIKEPTIDEKNTSGAESFPLLSWPSNCANGEGMTHLKSNGNVIIP